MPFLHRKRHESPDRSHSNTSQQVHSVPYDSARTSVPPKQQSTPLHGNQPLKFAPGSEQEHLVKDAADKARHNDHHRSGPLDQGHNTYQLPIRDGSNNWQRTKAGKAELAKSREQRPVDSELPPSVDPYVRDKLHYGSSETVHVDKKVAQPVVHETIHPHVRHIHHEHITREIHTHDIYHRILPLIEIEVLPAKHFFRRPSGELVPITEQEKDELAVKYGGVTSYTVTATANVRPAAEVLAAMKHFTARPIEPHEREVKRWVDEKGVERSEQYHFHPPVLLSAKLNDEALVPRSFWNIPIDGRTRVTRTVLR